MAQWFEMLMEGVERNLASRNRERYTMFLIIKQIYLKYIFFFLDSLKTYLHSKKS